MSAHPPFSCQFSSNFPELLMQLHCTLVVSTYQAGKLIFISPKDDESLVQLPRTFNKPMGLAIKGDRMAVATKSEVITFTNSKELAATYPKGPNKYDSFYLPMATYYTGQVDLHDLHFGSDGLWGVNTSFSCLCLIDDKYSFTPKWQPHFITDLVSEDRCHLNGLAMENGKPRYVSGLGSGNSRQSWRENITKGGIVMDIEANEIIAQGLAMPHSPRIYDGKLFVLLSADQKLICIDPKDGSVEDVAHVPGFVRGMTRVGDYVFIATSKLRKNSSTFKHLEIAEKANEASISAIHLPTGAFMGKFTYLSSVDEIYDIQVLDGMLRPNIANTLTQTHLSGLIIPDKTYWSVEKIQ